MIITGNKEKNADYYSEIYENEYNASMYYPLYQHCVSIIGTLSSPRILELGCGIGDLGQMIIERGYPYHGFDFSEEAIQQSLKKCPSGNFKVGNVYDKHLYQEENYNTVVALEVLEHVEDIDVIKNIIPGAIVIASVPDYTDAAHLRLYKDSQKDIIEYYKPYLHVTAINSAIISTPNSEKKDTIHIFVGNRLFD